jgi:hypothetical protein
MFKPWVRILFSILICVLLVTFLAYNLFSIILNWNPRWERTNLVFEPADKAFELFPQGQCMYPGGYTTINKCDFSDDEFTWYKFPPRNSVSCYTATNTSNISEGNCIITYLRDKNGVGWVYQHSENVLYSLIFIFISFCLSPTIGLIIGLLIGIFCNKKVEARKPQVGLDPY